MGINVEENDIVLHVTEIGGCIRRALLRLQGVEPTDGAGYHALIGTMVHKVAEHILKGGLVTVGIDKAEAIDPLFFGEYKPQITEKVERLLEWFEENPNVEAVAIEDTIREVIKDKEGVPILVNGRRVVVSGTPDLITKDQVIDFKSGKSRNKKQAWQVAAYATLYGGTEREGRVVYLGEVFETKVLKNGKIRKKHERIVPLEKMEVYKVEWLEALVEYINALDMFWGDVPEPEDCGDCFFCSFRTMDGMCREE